jgi:hypothetical protein
MFVLQESYRKKDTILGVFDSPEEITDAVLEDYYGAFELVEYTDIRDSGLEWKKLIRFKERETAHSYNRVAYINLTLFEFQLNAIEG